MTDAPPKRKRETWLDLLPEGAPRPLRDVLLTREELLEELQRRDVDVDEVALVYWEKSGVLPRAVRSRRAGRPVALYPEYAISAVAHLRELQEAGRTLEDIAPIMRTWALSPIVWEDPLSRPLNNVRAALLSLAQALGHDVASIRVVFLDDAGREGFVHEMPVPVDVRDEIPASA